MSRGSSKAGYSLIRPGRRHVRRAGAEEVEAFKKGLWKP